MPGRAARLRHMTTGRGALRREAPPYPARLARNDDGGPPSEPPLLTERILRRRVVADVALATMKL